MKLHLFSRQLKETLKLVAWNELFLLNLDKVLESSNISIQAFPRKLIKPLGLI